jgi:polar amino acid transport system substrate-binding protein
MIVNVAFRVGLSFAAILFVATSASAADLYCQALAPTGKLRAALYPGTPTSILDANEVEPRGVGFELGRALARRIDIPFEPLVFSKNAEVLEAIRTGSADVAFTNASPARQREMNFGPSFLIIELGYLVPAGSKITSSAEVDTTGVHVGVTAGSTSEATLSHELTKADLVRAVTNQTGAELLVAGKIDAFATNKATLFELADKAPGTQVLADRWGEERHAIAYPHGRERAAPCVKAFTEAAITDGLVKSAMERAGLRGAKTP